MTAMYEVCELVKPTIVVKLGAFFVNIDHFRKQYHFRNIVYITLLICTKMEDYRSRGDGISLIGVCFIRETKVPRVISQISKDRDIWVWILYKYINWNLYILTIFYMPTYYHKIYTSIVYKDHIENTGRLYILFDNSIF